jgi:hypothetical protein
VRLRGSTGELVTIPKTKETLKPKTLASALRQAGLTVEGLRREKARGHRSKLLRQASGASAVARRLQRAPAARH